MTVKTIWAQFNEQSERVKTLEASIRDLELRNKILQKNLETASASIARQDDFLDRLFDGHATVIELVECSYDS